MSKKGVLGLPKQEDVTDIDIGTHRVSIVQITDDNRDEILRVAMSMYLGESCKYCGKVYETLDDLKDTVWAGYHENGRLKCWKVNNP